MKGGLSRAAIGTLALLVCLTGRAGDAHAQTEAHLALHWVREPGAEACVDGTALARTVEERLGRPVFGPASQAEAWLEGQVRARSEGGYEASLRWVGPDGTRAGTRTLTSDAAACDDLSEAVALVVAVMIDPDAALRPTSEPADVPPAEPAEPAATTPETETETETETTEKPTEPLPAPVVSTAPPPARHAVGAVARVGLASLPTAQVGLGAFYAIDLPHAVRLRVEAIAFGKQSLQLTEQGAEVFLQPLSLAISACPIVASGHGLSLGVCGGATGGLLLQSSHGLDRGGNQVLGTLQLQAGLRGYWEAPRVRLGLGAAFSVAPVQQRLYVTDDTNGQRDYVYDQGTFGADLDATIAVRF